jgi:hypothetical protein
MTRDQILLIEALAAIACAFLAGGICAFSIIAAFGGC